MAEKPAAGEQLATAIPVELTSRDGIPGEALPAEQSDPLASLTGAVAPEGAAPSRVRLLASSLTGCLKWGRQKKGSRSVTSVAPASAASATSKPWPGFGGAGFWSVQTVRTLLFLGCLATISVSGLALFHGLHREQIAAIQDEPPELIELPPEQLQPKLAGSLPGPAPSAIPHPILSPPAPSAIPPAPTLPPVVTADASQGPSSVAPAVNATPEAPAPLPPAPSVLPPLPATPPAANGGANLEGGIEDDDTGPTLIIRANGTGRN